MDHDTERRTYRTIYKFSTVTRMIKQITRRHQLGHIERLGKFQISIISWVFVKNQDGGFRLSHPLPKTWKTLQPNRDTFNILQTIFGQISKAQGWQLREAKIEHWRTAVWDMKRRNAHSFFNTLKFHQNNLKLIYSNTAHASPTNHLNDKSDIIIHNFTLKLK